MNPPGSSPSPLWAILYERTFALQRLSGGRSDAQTARRYPLRIEIPREVTPQVSSEALYSLRVGTAGPRVAFLHGLFGQGRNWTQIAKAVAGPDGTGARCLLVDLPDHGRSPWSGEFSYEAYAAAVAATLEAAAPGEPWVLVGPLARGQGRDGDHADPPATSCAASSSSTSRRRTTATSTGSSTTSRRCGPCRSTS